MLSIDGFRDEYLTRGLTPSIEALRECGVRVPRMRPVFPSKTFTNHYSIATVNHPSVLTVLYSSSSYKVKPRLYSANANLRQNDPEFESGFLY